MLQTFYLLVATPLWFLHMKRHSNTPTETPNGLRQMQGYEKIEISTNISLYLGNDTRHSHTCYTVRIKQEAQLLLGQPTVRCYF